MRLTLVHGGHDGQGSTAAVSLRTLAQLNGTWNCFALVKQVQTHKMEPLQSCVYRLEPSKTVADGAIQLSHSMNDDEEDADDAPSSVDVELIASHCVRDVFYLELVPVDLEQRLLARSFTKSLLRKRVLSGPSGILTLVHEGISYGRWRFQAFCEGGSRSTKPGANARIVTETTLVVMLPFGSCSRSSASSDPKDQLPIGSHAQHFQELVAMALTPSRAGSLQTSEAVACSRTLLLHGSSGAGKTTLVQRVASDLHANLLTLDCSMLSRTEVRLEDLFTATLRIQPALLLLEDIDLLFPRTLDEAKYKLICRLVAYLDCINSLESARVAVVGTVSDFDMLHPKVRQLFADEVLLEMPEKSWTVDLLSSLHPKAEQLSDEFKMSVAVRYGQRPSNIVSIARQIHAKRASNSPVDSNTHTTESEISAYGRELSTTSSSALNSSVPNVSWDDIGGLKHVKQSLMEMVVWPLEKPQVFLRMGISPPMGMILHGPPGTGKTMLAKAAAKASGCNFLNVSASDLMKAEFGESEKAITRVFDTARTLSPCMVFIDEFQSLFGNRSTAGVTTSRMISQLLMEMDGLRAVQDVSAAHESTVSNEQATASISIGRVFVLAATNCLSAIDPALLQPGRFENIVYVGLPETDERTQILQIQKSKMPWHENVQLDILVDATKGANAASLVALCQSAAIHAMQRCPADLTNAQDQLVIDAQLIEMDDFLVALVDGNFGFEEYQ